MLFKDFLKSSFFTFCNIISSGRKFAGIPILYYHCINNDKTLMSVFPDEFDWQMSEVVKNGYRSISFSELYSNGYLNEAYVNKEKVILLTFDDGFRDNYTTVFPILKKYGLTATFFLTTDYIGKTALWLDDFMEKAIPSGVKALHKTTSNTIRSIINTDFLLQRIPQLLSLKDETLYEEMVCISRLAESPLLTWNEIQEMSIAGMEFGAHTCSHPFLIDLDEPEFRRQIEDSISVISKRIKKEIRTFCYPYGVFQNAHKTLLKEFGIIGAVSCAVGLNKTNDDLLRLKRCPVNFQITRVQFSSYFCGGYDTYLKLKKIFSALLSLNK